MAMSTAELPSAGGACMRCGYRPLRRMLPNAFGMYFRCDGCKQVTWYADPAQPSPVEREEEQDFESFS